nr:zinc finger BED domain-containing protein RICESLEEPER 2-like [Ipomoea batatas]
MPNDGASSSIPPLHPRRFEMELIRESAANWIMMHEHPFTILEEVGFNLMMKRGWPKWKKISRNTSKSDCLKWGIEKKVFTIIVDNASSSDSVIRYMKDTLQSTSLVMLEISVEYVNRWNSTFEMLSCALKFKETFQMLKYCVPFFDSCPLEDDWDKGPEYLTSNLFLQEVQKIKSALDNHVDDQHDLIRDLVKRMKLKFDKYWGECNLFMAIGVAFDPTKKMLAIELCFPKLYSDQEAKDNLAKVKEIINILYEEYVVESMNKENSKNLASSNTFRSQVSHQRSAYTWEDFNAYCAQVETS